MAEFAIHFILVFYLWAGIILSISHGVWLYPFVADWEVVKNMQYFFPLCATAIAWLIPCNALPRHAVPATHCHLSYMSQSDSKSAGLQQSLNAGRHWLPSPVTYLSEHTGWLARWLSWGSVPRRMWPHWLFKSKLDDISKQGWKEGEILSAALFTGSWAEARQRGWSCHLYRSQLPAPHCLLSTEKKGWP